MLAFLATLAAAIIGILLWVWWHRHASLADRQRSIPEPVAPAVVEPVMGPSVLQKIECLEREKESAEQEKVKLQQELARVEDEKAQLEAKYLAKVKAGDVRKANLAKYRQKNAATRKSLAGEVEDVVAGKDKWVPHGRVQPRHGQLGKPKGAPGGGKKRPDVIHKRIHVVPDTCAHCGADLSGVTAHVSHTHVFADLENLQGPETTYRVLTLLNTMLVMYRRRCPSCRKWTTASAGPLAYLRYGLNFVTNAISMRMRSRAPFEIILGELEEQFGDDLTLSAPALVDFFKRHEPILQDLYEQLKKIAALMANLHADETGLPMKRKNWWTWVRATVNC